MHLRLGICLLLSAVLGGCASPLRGGEPSGAPTAPAAAGEAISSSQDQEDGAGPAGAPGAPRPRERTGIPWADCYRRFEPSDDPAVDLSRLTAVCAARAGMVAVTPIHAASQGEADPPERLTFGAMRKRCYRAFAVGAPSVLDLDVAIKDARGDLVAADLSRDRWSVVPPRGPLCPPKSQRLTVEIAVAEGSGDYLFQIWGTDEEEEQEEATP